MNVSQARVQTSVLLLISIIILGKLPKQCASVVSSLKWTQRASLYHSVIVGGKWHNII